MSEYPPRVEVKFPSEMRVESPGTDKRIDALKTIFHSIAELLRDSMHRILDTLEVLRELPQLVRNLQSTVQDQFTNLFTHQIEAEIHSRHAALLSASKKSEVLRSELDRQMGRLPADRERISDRYSKLQSAVAGETETRIRDLDSHAFDLLDRVYPSYIQERFSYDSVPTVQFLAAEATNVAEVRAATLDESLNAVREEAASLLEARRQALQPVRTLLGPAGAIHPGWKELQCLFVEFEEPEGDVRRVLLPREGVGLEAFGQVESVIASELNRRADRTRADGMELSLAPLRATLAELMGDEAEEVIVPDVVEWRS